MNSISEQRLRRSVEEHGGVVARSLRRLGVPEPVIDDAAQQVLLVLHRRLPEVRSGSERAFMLATAHRVAADVRKSRRRSREEAASAVLDAVPDAAPSPEELLDRDRARALVDRAVASLPEDLRVVFVLMELEEKSTAYVAALLEVPPGTVASRLRRAREAYDAATKRLSRPRLRRALVLALPAAKWLSLAALAAGVALSLRPPGRNDVAPVAVARHIVAPLPSASGRNDVAPAAVARHIVAPGRNDVAPAALARHIVAPGRNDVAPAAVARHIVAPLPSAAAPPGIGEQLEVLQRVRAALAERDAASATAQLDAFDHAYPRSPLAEEAQVLRIDALRTAGQTAEAASAAASFHERHPNSAFREHVANNSSAL